MHFFSGSYWGMCSTKMWGQNEKEEGQGALTQGRGEGVSGSWLCTGLQGSFPEGGSASGGTNGKTKLVGHRRLLNTSKGDLYT